MKPAFGIAVLALCLCLAPVARGQEASDPASEEEIVARVLELKRLIEELMATLPPEIRDELRRRLAAVSPAPAESTDPVAEPAPVIEPAVPEAPAVEAPVEPPPREGIPKLIERRRRPACNTLNALDENDDGKISSADRYWRYVYLWTDRNGDGQLQDREVESAYDRKVREIAVSLETFIRAKGNLGEIRVEDRIVLDLRGDGFSERSRGDDGVLVVAADALGRGDGPRLLEAGGGPLSGFQPFRAGLRLEVAGAVTELSCP